MALNDIFYAEIIQRGLPKPTREYRFAAQYVGLGRGLRKRLAEAGLRDWRLDFAWVPFKITCEVEGGIWSGGRHVNPQGYMGDCEKYNAATLLGWRVYRIPSPWITDTDQGIRFLMRVFRDVAIEAIR